MCGIIGIINKNNEPIDLASLEQGISSLIHRGPDDSGIYVDGNVGFGHRRLSIIDLSAMGKQPLTNDKNLWIVFNGEIYNYVELKISLQNKGYNFKTQTDTEVILNCYKEYGIDCLKYLRGMFAFAIYDKQNKELFCARDRFGIKPFYYYDDDARFIFASEIKALFATSRVKKEPNYKMIYDFLVFNRTDHCEETCFTKIYNLKPGHYIKYSKGNLEIKRWYELPNIKTEETIKKTESEYIEEYSKLFKESIRLHMIGDVPVGACLSGGLDSSSIVLQMNKFLKKGQQLHTFTAVYNQDWVKDERKYATTVANKIGANMDLSYPTAGKLMQNIKNLIYCQEEPFSSTSIFASWCVMESAKNQKMKVLLDGQGADELLGYDYMAAFYFYELLRNTNLVLFTKELYGFISKQKSNKIFTLKLFALLLIPRFFRKAILHLNRNYVSKTFVKEYSKTSKFLDTFLDAASLNGSVKNHLYYKLTHLLRFEDKNSMAFSIETRVPFLDHILVEYLLNLPASMKIKNGRLKHILRESMKDYLPKSIYNRNNKVGFETPEKLWFQETAIKNMVSEKINRAIEHERVYINKPVVQKKLKTYLSGHSKWNQDLWNIFCLELWFETFIEKA